MVLYMPDFWPVNYVQVNTEVVGLLTGIIKVKCIWVCNWSPPTYNVV